MKVSVNWLREFIDVDLSIKELTDKIGAQLGAVEEVADLGKKYQGIIVVKVVTCAKHPNADKLSVCMIDDGGKAKDVERGKDGLVQVVCGAPNVKSGMLAAWLPPKSTVPASFDKEPFVLEAREIRGQVSNGMLASASELAISDDHSGIVELDSGKPGDDFAGLIGLDDFIIDIENKMFTHRPDCFGIYGVAREVAGITGRQFITPSRYIEKPESPKIESELTIKVDNNSSDLVPRFSAQVVENVHVKPSSVWLQAHLSRVGIRPVNNIVDVTNYIMYLTAQPLHAYDYDKLRKVGKTTTPSLETRLSRKGDKLKLLNGKSIKFEDKETILITSNNIPVGIGGVMGGADTEVDENTKTIVLESANFDMYSIRRTSMRHGLFTDAVARFNKGQSPLQTLAALYLASELTQQQAGGKIGQASDEHAKLKHPVAVHVTARFINERLGFDMSIKDMARLLKNVEFDVRINGPTLAVTPPFWRTDIEIPEDVVEEVGRLHGFDHLPVELPRRSVKPPSSNELLVLKSDIRSKLAAAGANEVLTYTFVHGNLIEDSGQDKKLAYKLTNALSPDLQYYRLSLIPSLLEKVHPNIKAGHEKFALYELGKTHNKSCIGDDKLPMEKEGLAFVYADGSKEAQAKPAYYQARKYLDNLLAGMNIEADYCELTAEQAASQTRRPFDFKRSAAVKDKRTGETLGIIGEFAPSLRRSLKLPVHCAGFEFSTAKLLACRSPQPYRKLSKYPSLTQDICLRVPAEVTYAQLKNLVQKTLFAADEFIKLEPLDIYQKEDSHKQITFRVTATSYTRTLKDEYVSSLLEKVEQTAKAKLKADRI